MSRHPITTNHQFKLPMMFNATQMVFSTLAAAGLAVIALTYCPIVSSPAEGTTAPQRSVSTLQQLEMDPALENAGAIRHEIPSEFSSHFPGEENSIQPVAHGDSPHAANASQGVRLAMLPVQPPEAAPATPAPDPDAQQRMNLEAAAKVFLEAGVLEFQDATDTPLARTLKNGRHELNRTHIERKLEFTFTPAWGGQAIESATVTAQTTSGRTLGSPVTLSVADTSARKVTFDVSNVANQGDVDILLGATIRYRNSNNSISTTDVASENTKRVFVDSIGPQLDRIEMEGPAEAPTKLRVYFREADFKATAGKDFKDAFFVNRLLDEGKVEPYSISRASTTEDNSYIVLEFPNLVFGTYRVSLPFRDTGEAIVVDAVENPAGANGSYASSQELIIDVYAKEPQGEMVEFPEFIPQLQEPRRQRRINPGDKVESAVVRLYYFRDAHRVAQLINRTVEPLRRAAVERAEIAATKARNDADELTRQRRSAERKAVKEAEDLRRAENEIAEGRRRKAAIDNEMQQIRRSIQINNQRIAKLQEKQNVAADPVDANSGGESSDAGEGNGTAPNPLGEAVDTGFGRSPFRQASAVMQEVESVPLPATSAGVEDAVPGSVQSQINDLVRSNDRLRARGNVLEAEEQRLGDYERSLDELRNKAFASNETALDLSEQEELQRANQFRLEVAAAHEDPDTYGAAKLDSVDPVAQVSISVIGEGLIQLRGPRKGINVIRTMIHQIDAPVGQVKVDVITVQVNGEDGNRMEVPVGKIDAQLKISRGLTSQCLMLLRQSIQQEATQIALMHSDGHYQVDRDRRYLYAFFGRDFIDELYEMESEFLDSENKILGLHSMDTISLHQALFVLALAKNDVRQRILANFMQRVHNDLIDSEFNMRRSSEVHPHKTRFWLPQHPRAKMEERVYNGVALNNQQRYHFTHLLNFFGSINGVCGVGLGGGIEGDSDTLNPVQREFIRLAQIFKARLVTELELKQRLIERTMIEDNVLNEINEEEIARNSLRPRVLQLAREIQDKRLTASQELATAQVDADYWQDRIQRSRQQGKLLACDFVMEIKNIETFKLDRLIAGSAESIDLATNTLAKLDRLNRFADAVSPRTDNLAALKNKIAEANVIFTRIKRGNELGFENLLSVEDDQKLSTQLGLLINAVTAEAEQLWTQYSRIYVQYVEAVDPVNFDYRKAKAAYEELKFLERALQNPDYHRELFDLVDDIQQTARSLGQAELEYKNAKEFLRQTRSSLEQRKLLDFLIHEQEERLIDLLEGTRARIAAIDGYLKRLSVALEDDFQVQFYDPAFVKVRQASRNMNVTFGQVEKTSVLTNNRAFAKVSPQATMEFDLPKRKIAIVEALDGAKALAQDYGALLQDPTFLAAFQMMGGAPSNGMVQNVYPSLPTSGEQEQMGFAPLPDQQSGSALQALVPDPSIYKIETGTGYEIRPVIQPDGISVVYDFNYMYTTNVREPVAADEKHLGRVKRHFINTQVQTASFEMRRVSRYQVALKVSRTSQGVPLFQDIPVMGALFRPAPSDESAIQENIILAQSVVYPTVFDVMGLRWAPSVVDLNHVSVRDREHVVRGRGKVVEHSVFDETTRTVDEVLGLNRRDPRFNRPDLYHQQHQPSPYHPGGYVYPDVKPDADLRGRGFLHQEQRPNEFQDPPFDQRRRVPMQYEGLQSEESYLPPPVQSAPMPDATYEPIDLGTGLQPIGQ